MTDKNVKDNQLKPRAIIDDPAQLFEEAYEHYKASNYAAARINWARAKTVARNLGDQAEAFRMGFWEGEALLQMQSLKDAFALLFSLYCQPPPDAPPPESWYTASRLVWLQLRVRPEKPYIERRLAELQTLCMQLSASRADFLWLSGLFAAARGMNEASLSFSVEAWQCHTGFGYLRSRFAFDAATQCLELDRRDEAESWLHRARPESDCHLSERYDYQRGLCLLALFDRNVRVLREYFEIGDDSQSVELRAHLLYRDGLLDPIHDPDDSTHPAWKLARTTQTENVHARYDSLMAQVDYRLACLRFTAGLPARDDLYYRHPDELPRVLQVSDMAKFQRQLHGFRRSWRRLWRHAEYVDGLLECQWRMRECETRWTRAQRIAGVCGIEFPAFPAEAESRLRT